MKKTDKKIENSIRETLTLVCETAQNNVDGFEWLTHSVHYGNVEASMRITCIFDTNSALSNIKISKHDEYLYQLIKQALSSIDIHIKDIKHHVYFDTEENCIDKHNGKWRKRLAH
ncbi:Fis family transcriptional regulator [Shewanella sp. VB17]|uniref:Fis family transcriptional regulator n=1 Tax=Shewanella sp. VB17 TaxID=2739432 RepID=UPI0015635F39|nr:Fis family transcriptional regulator [Shewanella sp. VB17]NRD73145.1 Fis family transcriptional regulator [Shewanella sp. VB17]